MTYSVLNSNGRIRASSLCIEDSNVGFEANFSENGEVDGWDYYSGVHTYGCWNGYLFGTIWRGAPVIGRSETFLPIPAEYFYTVRLTMKLRLVDRAPGQVLPTRARFAWRSLNSPTWLSSQQQEFDLYTDTEWHTYVINMGENPFWLGSINDLRFYMLGDDGKDGDKFFITTLEISSENIFRCNRQACSSYNEFRHNCPGVGKRGYCKSEDLAALYIQGSLYDMSEESLYTIEEDVNDILKVNINGYGYENVQLPSKKNINGIKLAVIIENELSKVDIGGYSECEVEYTDRGAFIIHAGNYSSDSEVIIGDSVLARQLNFYDGSGKDISTKVSGTNPASKYTPVSSFRTSISQINSLMDADEVTEFFFNPFSYSIEGGRNDWLSFGLGNSSSSLRNPGGATMDSNGLRARTYYTIENVGKTIIDFNHPFNASGRISKVYAGVTLDVDTSRGGYDAIRITNQLYSAKIMFFRPRKDGSFATLPIEIDIPDRDHASGNLYSSSQEYTEIDCDIFVNKGDFIGVYNANVFKGPSVSGEEIDALYYQIDGKPVAGSIVSVNVPEGVGSAGLMLYARSDYQQKRLVLDIDFGKRINLESVDILGRSTAPRLEYNIARCLDINWKVDLFNGDWSDHFTYTPGVIHIPYFYNHPSIAYGVECLSDGIRTVVDGLSAEAFSVDYVNHYVSEAECAGKKDGGKGVVLTNPKYFSVNADSEWLGIYALVPSMTVTEVYRLDNFDHDPIAFTLTLPNGSEASIHKSVIYFKEKFNFRSFALSTYNGPTAAGGDADDDKYSLIPYRLDGYDTPWSSIALDGVKYTPEDSEKWSALNVYLAQNPCEGDKVLEFHSSSSATIVNMDQYVQSLYIDWTMLQHEWAPITCKGFRFYTSYHESTKICEMEVYAAFDADESELTSALSLLYSAYEDYWTFGAVRATDGGAELFIGDTPQKMQLIIRPTSELYLSTISLNVSVSDVYMGEKGCETNILPIEAKSGDGVNNIAKRVDFKNVYGSEYDLYVSIADDTSSTKDTVFYSILDSDASISNPEIGPDAYYKKSPNYKIKNYNNNVAINCPVHKLVNLAHGAKLWYSHNNEYSWEDYGVFDEAEELGFSNLPNSTISTLYLPRRVRSKWWKIGFLDDRVTTAVKELKIYVDEKEILDATFYHHKGQGAYVGGNTNTAPHLQNNIIDGSYYVLKGDQYIGIELSSASYIDKIVFYHNILDEIENSHDNAGVDRITGFLLRSDGLQYETDQIYDYSYYEHPIEVVGSGIYNDSSNRYTSYELYETFSGCGFDTEWMDKASFSYNGIYSTYACLSGVCPTVSGGYARGFSFWTGNYNNNSVTDGTYHVANIFEPEFYPIDQDYTFTLRFVCKGGTALRNGTTNDIQTGFSMGVLGRRRRYFYGYNSWYTAPYTSGAQIAISQYEIRLCVRDDYSNFVEGNYFRNLAPKDNVYYYELTSDGNGTYGMTIWSGGFDGTVVASDTLVTTTKWSADKIGIGSGDVTYRYDPYLCSGWVGDIQFTCSKLGTAGGITGSSVRFSGYQDSYLQVDYNNSAGCNYSNSILNFGDYGFCIDFRIRPNSIPDNYEDIYWIAGCWHPDQALSGTVIYPSSWLLYGKRTSANTCKMYFIYNNSGTVYTLVVGSFWLEINRWTHVYVGHGQVIPATPSPITQWYPFIIKDGYTVMDGDTYFVESKINITYSEADLIVGKGFDGNIEEFRISCDPYRWRQENFGTILFYIGSSSEDSRTVPVPTRPYERYYTLCVYDSIDNFSYGKTMDVDFIFTANNLEYVSGSEWSRGYYSYITFDLGQRHDLWLIRSFPIDTAYLFNLSTNTLYSNKDTSDPVEAFYLTEEEKIVSTDFSGQNYSFPPNWRNIGSADSVTHILDNKLYQKVIAGGVSAQACAESSFYLLNDLDLSIDYNIGPAALADENTWLLRIGVIDINNSNNAVWFERTYTNNHNRYRIYIKNNSTTWATIADWWTSDKEGTLRIFRGGNTFNFYTKTIDQSEEDFTIRAYYKFLSFGIETKVQIVAKTDSTEYPDVEVWWDNFVLRSGSPIFSSSQDARWVKIKMYNGDGVTRTIKRLGIYPDVTTLLTTDGKHNCKWAPLGTAVTEYITAENVALGATVSGSSYAGYMAFENIVDGIVPDNLLNLCWGSDNAQENGIINPWIEIVLSNVEQIYRVKIYHGCDELDSDNIITDYKIHISEDSINYTTIFNITGNSDFERTHDLTYPVSAKYIRLEVVSYKSVNKVIITTDGKTRYWKGAVLREVEVYKYYGFMAVNSEESPVIAVDLQEAYYIYEHSLVGVATENSQTDWDNSDSNFTYANSNLSDPSKIAFRPWGSEPGYDSWVLIQRNTATHYPQWIELDPTKQDMPDLLKHVVIKATFDEAGTPINPIEYPWMWKSSISALSYDYDYLSIEHWATRSLKISYPASVATDHIYFIEGDDFGWDRHASFRDGLGINIYIDNIDNLDLGYGYIYFGGYDATQASNSIIHRWNFSTVSGSLASGWNSLHLNFSRSDHIDYTKPHVTSSDPDPRLLHTINWGRMGIWFRGKGNPLTMYIDGCNIRRSRFESLSHKGPGLYLSSSDFLKTNIANIDFSSTTIEFWIRPDWDFHGTGPYYDYYNRTLFHFGNTSNDVFGVAISQKGVNIYYGNVLNNFRLSYIDLIDLNYRDIIFHMAFVISNNGESISSDGSTIRLYINNVMVAKSTVTWEVSDNKHYNFMLGAGGLLAQKAKTHVSDRSSADAVISRLKIHDYCKTDFSDSIDTIGTEYTKGLHRASEFIEISKDNLTFVKVGSNDLPFYFERVPAGDSIPIWVKISLPRGLTGAENRTAGLVGSWDIGV